MEPDVVESALPPASQKSWREVLAELRSAAFRHKLISVAVLAAVLGSLGGIAAAGLRSSPASASGPAGSGSGSWAVQPSGSPAAPAFGLPLLGHPGRVSLAQYAGRSLIVNFFASWCHPCAQETPMLARFYREHHGSVALVGIDGSDTTSSALAFSRSSGIGYPVGWDPQVSVGLAYGVNAQPQTFFLDARHRVVYRVYGAVTATQLAAGLALASR